MEREEKRQTISDDLFASPGSVRSERILYTPSHFAKTSLLHLQEIGSLTALAPHTSSRAGLNSYLCFQVEEGDGILCCQGREYSLSKGDVVFLDCRSPYSHRTGNQLWTLRWCHFYGPSLPAVYAKYLERGGQPVIHRGQEEGKEPYERLLKELYGLAGSDDYIRDMRINETLSALLTCLMSDSWHPESRGGSCHTKKQDIVRIKSYLDAHYTEKITLETVAGAFFINKHYLARLFKLQYGVTVNGYLQQARITRAKQLLRFTDEKIEAVGARCGMEDVSYFSRIFKKVEGISPREFRERW